MFPSNPNFSASSPPQDSPITLQIEDWDITSGSTPENGPFSRSCPSHSTLPRAKRSSLHPPCEPDTEDGKWSETPLNQNHNFLHPESLQKSLWMSRSLNTVLPFNCTRTLPDYGSTMCKINGRNRSANIPEITQDALCPSMLNVYQQKKSLAEGMMDLALFSTNANQLRYELQHLQPGVAYDYVNIVCLSISLIMQCVVGVGLILNSRYDVMKKEGIKKADKINDWTVVLIFLITVINVFIGSFGVATTTTTSET